MILDGNKLNAEIASVLKTEIQGLDIKPKLCIIQIGDNAASNVYVNMKVRYAEKIGAISQIIKFNSDISENEIIEKIKKLNNDRSVNGIIVQLPIPENLDVRKIINTIDYLKDVDGLSDVNLAKLISNEKGLRPATARGILTLLDSNDIEIEGKHVVVIGRSLLVGKSSAINFLNRNATVTVCHSKTKDLVKNISLADIIVTAAGYPGIIDNDMINDSQVIVDVGISVVNGEILGDASGVGESSVYAISPVPGGVGPMTVASLFENLLDSYHLQYGV